MWFQRQSGNVIYNLCHQWIRYSLVHVTKKERRECVKSLFICIWCRIKCLHLHLGITLQGNGCQIDWKLTKKLSELTNVVLWCWVLSISEFFEAVDKFLSTFHDDYSVEPPSGDFISPLAQVPHFHNFIPSGKIHPIITISKMFMSLSSMKMKEYDSSILQYCHLTWFA